MRKGMLIIEGRNKKQEELCRIFETTYEILKTQSREQAMQLLEQSYSAIQVIVLGAELAEESGLAFLEEYRKTKYYKLLPVVMRAESASAEDELRAFSLGVADYIKEPTADALVKARVNRIADGNFSCRRGCSEQEDKNAYYMLHKSLIGQKKNTFLCIYHFESKEVEIGENGQHQMSDDFKTFFQTYPFSYQKFVLAPDSERVGQFFDVMHNPKVQEEIQVRFRVDYVHYEWFEISKVVHFDALGKPESVIFLFFNTDNAVEAKENLRFLAHNDDLTRIPNMQSFISNVTSMLRRNPKRKFMMITLDIFQFRVVNKLFGHKVGDNIIRYLAMKLQEKVEGYEIGAYGRLSSDAFAVCISQQEDIEAFMQELQMAMHNYHLKFQMRLCFGIYRIRGDEGSVDVMIEHSTFARKRAKEVPIKLFVHYDDDLQKREMFETIVVSEMDIALDEEQFEVYMQPKCNTRTGRIVGAEALLRWNHPERGYLSPGNFIPIFEQNGSCLAVDYFVYEKVCSMLREALDRGEAVVPVSANVSRWNLYDSDLADKIIEIVDRYRVPHDLIEFEITESAFVVEAHLMSSFSERMRREGFHILIDDFGSGYSSLNSLKDISVDVLKIDINFLPVAEKNEKAKIVLSAVISMARELGLGVIAEGVEIKEQVELLELLGCDDVQGFYFYKPLSVSEYQKVLQENRSHYAV